MKDLTGQVFGYNEVLSKAPRVDNRAVYYVRCNKCGTTRTLAARELTSRGSTMCVNCSRSRVRIDLVGKIFGDYEVLEEDGKVGKFRMYKCRCKLCGNIYTVYKSSLLSGESTRCTECSRKTPAVMIGATLSTKIYKNNTTGVRGVFYDVHRDRWRAMICLRGHRTFVGTFGTKEEAIVARERAQEHKIAQLKAEGIL